MINDQTKDLTEIKEFKPSPGMQLWLERSIELETDSITDIAEACKMSRQSWYEFQKVPGFVEWYDAEWTRRLQGYGWKLDVYGMKNAKKDVKYWELMQKRLGRLQEKNTNVQVNILNHLKKEQDEFGIQ